MNKQLEEVDLMYQEVQPYIDPTFDELKSRTEVHQLKLQMNKEKYIKVYDLALEKLKLLLPHLSTGEIVDGYREGCRLLQRGLSGYMADHFHSDYVPTMVNAIKRPDLHTAWIFLQALANNLGRNISSLAIEALDTKGLTETALNVVEQLNITEALPKIRELTKDKDDTIASLAGEVSKHLEKQM